MLRRKKTKSNKSCPLKSFEKRRKKKPKTKRSIQKETKLFYGSLKIEYFFLLPGCGQKKYVFKPTETNKQNRQQQQ